jgi:hypothetical protein
MERRAEKARALSAPCAVAQGPGPRAQGWGCACARQRPDGAGDTRTRRGWAGDDGEELESGARHSLPSVLVFFLKKVSQSINNKHHSCALCLIWAARSLWAALWVAPSSNVCTRHSACGEGGKPARKKMEEEDLVEPDPS